MKVFILMASVAFLRAPFAFGQTECANATTDAAMRSCEITRYDAARGELAAVVHTLTAKLDAAGLRRFNTSQTIWLRFRAANADFLSQSAGGGSMALLIKETVLADMTVARTKELRQALKP